MHEHEELLRIPNPFHSIAAGSRTFRRLQALVRVHLTKGGSHPFKGVRHSYKGTRHWILQIHFGTGAGYVWGRTLYVAHNALDRKAPLHSGKRKWLDVGFTQNANLVPYGDGY